MELFNPICYKRGLKTQGCIFMSIIIKTYSINKMNDYANKKNKYTDCH